MGNDGNRLASALHTAISGNKSSIDAGLLLDELMAVWGGASRLARDMYAEFESAPKGSMIRQRMLEVVQRLVLQATARDQAKVTRPEDMTDADLEQLAMSYVTRLSQKPKALPSHARPGIQSQPDPDEEMWADE